MIRGLDHVVHAVRDLEAARRHYGSLGFTLTPRALHPWGTANSLVQLDHSFIEILAVEQPERITPAGTAEFSFGDYNRHFLAADEGMSMLVFSSLDARADQVRWSAAGLDTYAPFRFSRTARLPGGEEVTVAFSLAFVTHPEMPRAAWFVCQQHNPEHFWKPEFQRHDNGAARMQRVWLRSEDPARHAAFLGALFPGECELRDTRDGVDLVLGHGEVAVRRSGFLLQRFPGIVLPPAEAGPAFVAVTLASAPGHDGLRESVAGLVLEVVPQSPGSAAHAMAP